VTFAPNLQDCLRDRTTRAPFEFAEGRKLEEVLNRHLLTVESRSDTVLLTSILLLDRDKKRLWHAAAPSLPQAYCEAINGAEIGPAAGSCGTAAFLRRTIYVTDIATDPLWSDYRHLALPHGLRACWSTPIYLNEHDLVGTFAVYHLTARSPTRSEVDAIDLIAGHVAQAIEWSREVQYLHFGPESTPLSCASLGHRGRSDDTAPWTSASEANDLLRSIESDFQNLAAILERAIEALSDAECGTLFRAKEAAVQGASVARKHLKLH
jgi:hypothetical protein